MTRAKQEWSCTLLMPDGSCRVEVVTVEPPMAQASAEVLAIKSTGAERCMRSYFVREVPNE